MKQSAMVARNLICLLCSIAAVCSVAAAAQPKAGEAQPDSYPAGVRNGDLAVRLKGLITANGVALSDAGIRMVSAKTGETLLDNCSDKLFAPASNQKLATTAAALHLLGKEFRFETKLYARGTLQDGSFIGDLIVVGCGDPDISGRNHDGDPRFLFKAWGKTLREFGVKEVRGNIIGDVSAFDTEYVHPSWPANQQERWYCAPASALALNDNCLDITVSPGEGPGMPARLRLSPDTAYTRVDNHCTTTNVKGEHAYGFLGRAGIEGLIVRGKFWMGGEPATSWVPVDDPPLFFLTVMRETLMVEGIPVLGKVVVAADPVAITRDEKLLATFTTPLERAVMVANKQSQNFYAEQLLKTIGSKTLKKGTYGNGAAKVREFLGAVSQAGSACEVDDGSGLSRKNRLNAAAVTDLLLWVIQPQRPEAKTFVDSLSVAGVDGTMDDRFEQEPYRGHIKAKTGTIAGVSTLSGYIEVPGDVIAFSMLMNSSKAGVWRMKKAQDAICKAVIDCYLGAGGVAGK